MKYLLTLDDEEYESLKAESLQNGVPIAEIIRRAIGSRYHLQPMLAPQHYSASRMLGLESGPEPERKFNPVPKKESIK